MKEFNFDFSKAKQFDINQLDTNKSVQDIIDEISKWRGKQVDIAIVKEAILKAILYDKLCQDFGIDLITLFKAIKRGYIWVNNEFDGKPEKQYISMYDLENSLFICHDNSFPYLFSEYGKTWALTRKELEK